MSKAEYVLQDYASTSLSLKAHPVSLIREKLKMFNVKSSQEIRDTENGRIAKVSYGMQKLVLRTKNCDLPCSLPLTI